MKQVLQHVLIVFILFLAVGIFSQVHATSFELVAPSGELKRGDNVSFTVNIDTQSQTLTSTTVGITYKTEFLQYVSATAGNTFTTITPKEQPAGTVVLDGSNTSGFSGTGTYATVTFKIIAEAPGETELCTLTNPTTPTPVVTAAPQPTSLPLTGEAGNNPLLITLGTIFIGSSLVFFLLSKRHGLHKR